MARSKSSLKSAWIALVAGTALGVAACTPASDSSGEAAADVASDKTVASLLAGDDGFASIAEVLAETGVASAFDGAGAYTVLAPKDDALGTLSEGDEGMDDAERRVLLIALLRNHILPGEVTPASIREALEAAGGAVEMRNLAGGTVTFSMDGDAITVEGQEGLSATIDGDTLIGSNGAIIPVDGPLAPLPEGTPEAS